MASSNNCPWKDEIHQKLITTFENDSEALIRVLWYLDEEDIAYKDSQQIPPVWRTLKSVLTSSDAVIKKYAERLAEDTKRAEKDVAFRKTMNIVYSQMMDASENPLPDGTFQKFDVARITDLNVAGVSASMGLVQAWSRIPVSSQRQILEIIPKIISNRQIVSSVNKVVGLANKAGGSLVMVALAVLQLGWDAVESIYLWWKGEITGKRCCKNIIDSTFTIGAGVAGSIGGAAIGAIGGPVGVVIGGVVGGVISSQAMNFFIDRLTQTLFGIPKDKALENAYKFFGVEMSASNSEINAAYHKLCLKHHPDKGGNSEEFRFVQSNMGVIKAARDDL